VPSPVQSLGYVGLRATDIDDRSGYGTRLIGLQAVDRSRATLALRMDDRRQRLIVHADGGDGIFFRDGRWPRRTSMSCGHKPPSVGRDPNRRPG
jgi:hypothetical protein